MVGHVEGIEACGRVAGQGGGALLRIEQRAAAFHVGHLPQAGDHARDLQPRRQQGALGAGTSVGAQRGSRACTACTSSMDIWPTVVTSPLVIFQVRKGPTMSPLRSNWTGPITPT